MMRDCLRAKPPMPDGHPSAPRRIARSRAPPAATSQDGWQRAPGALWAASSMSARINPPAAVNGPRRLRRASTSRRAAAGVTVHLCIGAARRHHPIVASDRSFHVTPPRRDRSGTASNGSARQSLLMQTGSAATAGWFAASPPATCCKSSSCNSGAPGFFGILLDLVFVASNFLGHGILIRAKKAPGAQHINWRSLKRDNIFESSAR